MVEVLLKLSGSFTEALPTSRMAELLRVMVPLPKAVALLRVVVPPFKVVAPVRALAAERARSPGPDMVRVLELAVRALLSWRTLLMSGAKVPPPAPMVKVRLEEMVTPVLARVPPLRVTP